MQTCPYCAEEIRDKATRCRYCHAWLTTPDRQSQALEWHRPLTRSRSDRMVAGVCAGIANYVGMDVTVVRVIYALVMCFTAIVPGIIAYLALTFLIPPEATTAV